MAQFYNVAKNSFRECLREPIFFILLVSALGLIGMFPTFSMFVFREQIKLVIDSAMATTLVFGLVVAVLAASHTVAREMRNGTVLLLMSKPVQRWSFILAKIAGTLCALTVFVFLCNLASLVSLRVAKDQFQLDYMAMFLYYLIIALSTVIGLARNYLSQVSFASNAVFSLLVMMPILVVSLYFIPINGQIGALNFEVVPALILIVFAIWAMGTITVALSTRLDMVPNLTVCAIIFSAGLMSNYFFGESAETSVFGFLIYAIIPNWQFFWMADALASNQTIPTLYIFWAFIYILLYMGVCSIIAIALFHEKELASDSK